MQSLDPPATAGSARAAPSSPPAVVQNREAETFCFEDDGLIPNHPAWPLIIYHGAVRLAEAPDPAAVFEQLFAANGWGDGWRDGIYPEMHYHSRIHEVLGVARGVGRIRFGGARGRALALKAGDVAVLPAGTGHQCIEANDDFLVVGAYPPNGTYDECRDAEDRVRALRSIPQVARPDRDPVYGAAGPLTALWKGCDV
ncbi:MAG: cupin domain-containing protein [Xanthobacteraceae bacterium]|nr:cupin domain-containing protein [Xanthobacteraceae bacterium]